MTFQTMMAKNDLQAAHASFSHKSQLKLDKLVL
jgi:hypothetical protein